MAVDGEDVLVDCGPADAEGGCGVFFGEAFEDGVEDVALPGGEVGELWLGGGGEGVSEEAADFFVDAADEPPLAAGEGWLVGGAVDPE